MGSVKSTIQRQSTFLFWEFVVIVLGVLSALAVDQWREEQALRDQRRHVLESLLTDLREDRADYSHFVENTRARASAATYLDSLAHGSSAELPAQFRNAGEAIHFVALTARLQTYRSAIQEISSTGARTAIEDEELRERILQYYATATDRSAVNQFIEPELQRFRATLEQLGVSYADAGEIDAVSVLANKTVHALIRSIGKTAEFAPRYCEDLIALNEALIDDIERILSEY